MAKKAKTIPRTTPTDAPADEAATQAESRDDAAVSPPPHDAVGGDVQSTEEDVDGEIGPGEQLDGQGLPPVATAKSCLRVAARRDGFRRCGRAWPAAGVTVLKIDFSDDQIATLLADPDLVVTEVVE